MKIAETSPCDDQGREGDLINDDDGFDPGLGHREIGADRGDRDIDDERVHHEHELRGHDDGKRPPSSWDSASPETGGIAQDAT